MASRSRFGGFGGSFQAVRSLVSFLRLRGSRAPRISTGGGALNYTKSWSVDKYMEELAVNYLERRPEYNAGWASMVGNMIDRIKNGGYVYGKINKTHTYGGPADHSVSYQTNWLSNLKNATGHPDLMSNYIDEINAMYSDYFQKYEDSECSNVSSEEEWAIRRASLDEYKQLVEETLSESD